MTSTRAILLALALVPALGGCKWLKSPGKDNVEPPAELTEIKGELPVQKLWSHDLGDGVGKSGTRLKPAYREGRLYATDGDGNVVALDAERGSQVWKTDTDTELGSGPGLGGGIVAVGSLHGQVIALDASDGHELWRAEVSSEVIATPAVSGDLVVARAHDGRLYALDAKDGTRRWVFDRTVPLLSLRGNGAPVIAGDRVLVPFDNGKLIALKLSDGGQVWEQTVANPEGRTELSRMVDIDGDIAVGSGEVYACTYQGQIAGVTLDAGRQLWTREFSAYGGIATGGTQLYAADADGTVWAFDARSGGSLWKQDALAHRALSTPAAVGNLVAVGDFEGYVHWLKSDTGELVARTKLGGGGVRAAPVAANDVLFVTSAKGDLAAFRVSGG